MKKTIGLLCGCGLVTLAIGCFLQGHPVDGWFAWFVGLHYLREILPDPKVDPYGDLTKIGNPW